MTEHDVDRMIRDADPARPGVHLDGAERLLLEQIVAEPVGEPFFRRYGGALAAAAVLAVALAVPAVPQLRAGQAPAPAAPSLPVVSNAPVAYAAAVQRSAEENPRLLIDQPGWTAVRLFGFGARTGDITWVRGGLELEITWYPDEAYPDYYRDRLHVSDPEKTRVAGHDAAVFRYTDQDFAVMLKPFGDTFVEYRTKSAWSRAEFDRVLADIVQVDVRTWLKALPAEVVTPAEADAAAAGVLDGVPLPPGYAGTFPESIGVNDESLFATRLIGLVGCGWTREWQRARTAGDQAAVDRAAAVLTGSHDWPVLRQLEGTSGWSRTFWQIADGFAAGRPPQYWESTLRCDP